MRIDEEDENIADEAVGMLAAHVAAEEGHGALAGDRGSQLLVANGSSGGRHTAVEMVIFY